MNQTALNKSSGTTPGARTGPGWHWLASGLALTGYLLVLLTWLAPLRLPGKAGWPEAVLILTATLTTLVSLSRRLPGQNVILAAAIIGLIGGAVHAVGAATAIPFGPFTYTDSAGPKIFGTLAWPVSFLWIIIILNSRGVARLILRPWRKLRSYGFWLMGITAALAVFFDAAMEPFAADAKHYWLWHPTRLPLTWGGAPVTNYLGWLVAALLILAFATPALIDKRHQRTSNRPPDYHPLAVWLLALVLFAVGTGAEQLWPAVIYCVAVGGIVTVFAVRGAKW